MDKVKTMSDCSSIGWGASVVCSSTSGFSNLLGPILILAGIALIYIAFSMGEKKEAA